MSFIAWDIPTILVLLLLLAMAMVLVDKFFFSANKTTKFSIKRLVYFLLFLKTHKHQNLKKRSKVVQWSVSLYPVLLLVLVIRSFIAEPFRIPSNSMMPTLLTGDFILVNKFTYGIRLPVINTKLMDINQPKYGDILVFRYPNYERDSSKSGLDYIKRIVGVPGDEVLYKSDQLWVNGKAVTYTNKGDYYGVESGSDMTGFIHQLSDLGGIKYERLLHPKYSSKAFAPCSSRLKRLIRSQPQLEFYTPTLHCSSHYKMTIPEGYYLVFGDNRSASADGRFWGLVPDEFVIGKAFFIWMHFDKSFKFGRLGPI